MTASSVEGLFKISRNDGTISVLAQIDREVVGDTITLTVKVQFVFFNPIQIITVLLKLFVQSDQCVK